MSRSHWLHESSNCYFCHQINGNSEIIFNGIQLNILILFPLNTRFDVLFLAPIPGLIIQNREPF